MDGIPDSMDLSLNKPQEIVKDREAWCAVVHELMKSPAQLGDRKIRGAEFPEAGHYV